jgi:hypothetical protein
MNLRCLSSTNLQRSSGSRQLTGSGELRVDRRHSGQPRKRRRDISILSIGVATATRDADANTAEFHEALGEVQNWLEFVSRDVSTFEAPLVRKQVARIARRDRVTRELAVADKIARRFQTGPEPGDSTSG